MNPLLGGGNCVSSSIGGGGSRLSSSQSRTIDTDSHDDDNRSRGCMQHTTTTTTITTTGSTINIHNSTEKRIDNMPASSRTTTATSRTAIVGHQSSYDDDEVDEQEGVSSSSLLGDLHHHHHHLPLQHQMLFQNHHHATTTTTTTSEPPVCLEGILKVRKGRHWSSGHGSSLLWKRRYVHLSFHDGGSIRVYRNAAAAPPQHQEMIFAEESQTGGEEEEERLGDSFEDIRDDASFVSSSSTKGNNHTHHHNNKYQHQHQNHRHHRSSNSSKKSASTISKKGGKLGGGGGGDSSVLHTMYSRLHKSLSSSMILPIVHAAASSSSSSAVAQSATMTTAAAAVNDKSAATAANEMNAAATATGSETTTSPELEIFIPSHVPWMVKDVENTPGTFCVELPTGLHNHVHAPGAAAAALAAAASFDADGLSILSNNKDSGRSSTIRYDTNATQQEEEYPSDTEEVTTGSATSGTTQNTNIHNTSTSMIIPPALQEDMHHAKSHGHDVLRVYFRCHIKGGNEKALWLKAFSGIHRLSDESRKCSVNLLVAALMPSSVSSLSPLPSFLLKGDSRRGRFRSERATNLARDTRDLEMLNDDWFQNRNHQRNDAVTSTNASRGVSPALLHDDYTETWVAAGAAAATATVECSGMGTADALVAGGFVAAATSASAFPMNDYDYEAACGLTAGMEEMARGNYVSRRSYAYANNVSGRLSSSSLDLQQRSNNNNSNSNSKLYDKQKQKRRRRQEQQLQHQHQDPALLPEKEYRVLPAYAYPHRWMSRREMREEMVLPSTQFHDLRVSHTNSSSSPSSQEQQPHQIGSLRMEVLQCLGLPKLDRTSDTDAVVYLVCGSYAFATDVIPNRANPMWLRKSRRACIFPLFHAYARLYVGVFDDDHNRVKDDFAGRVVIDLARLRPSSTYDVTLPLRVSTHAYSRKRRGAVRLRFTLNWNSEREALMSYIPKKIPRIPLPQHSKPNMDVTVACADQKSFRNIAVTVHGAHMPGRFTFPKVKAAIREMNFTRKFIFCRIRQEIREIRNWEIPSVSAFVFAAWMHCCYANAFSLVPAYAVLYFWLILARTYAIYGIGGSSQRGGFAPPTWEELFLALLWGGESNAQDNPAIAPLDLSQRSPSSRRRTSSLGGESTTGAITDPLLLEDTLVDYKASTHAQVGVWLLRALGLLPDNRNSYVDVDENHLEFPFANGPGGMKYPKFRVRDCLREEKADHDRNHNSASDLHDTRVLSDNNGEIRLIPREFSEMMRKDSSGLRDYDGEEGEFSTRHAFKEQRMAAAEAVRRTATDIGDATGLNQCVVTPIRSGIDQVTSGVSHMMEQRQQQPYPVVHARSSSDSEMSGLNSEVLARLNNNDTVSSFVDFTDNHSIPSSTENVSINETTAWPEQDVDVEGKNNGRKLTDDLADIQDKMHELTWHLFDDKIYDLGRNKDPSTAPCYFGESKKSEKRRGDVSKKLDRLLQVGQYSHSNPFVARLGLYVEPICGSVLGFLCFFRASFNALTWQDPILTFWLSVFSLLLAIILFIFPWRIFLFILGVFLVGPQNYVIRILRERGHLPPAQRKRRPESEDKKTVNIADQPVFYSHSRKDGINRPKNREDVDPREIHRVVVPYGPLMYQRFYDWPPEPQYAQVKPEDVRKLAKPAAVRNRAGTGSSMAGNSVVGTNTTVPVVQAHSKLQQLRRRFQRRSQVSPIPPHDASVPSQSASLSLPSRGKGRGRKNSHDGPIVTAPPSPPPPPPLAFEDSSTDLFDSAATIPKNNTKANIQKMKGR